MAEDETPTLVSGVDDGSTSSGQIAAGDAGQGAPTAGASREARAKGRSLDIANIGAKYGLLIAFGLVFLVFSLLKPSVFPTGGNIESMLTLASPAMIIAVALTVVLVMQDFDLSFGSMIGLAGGALTALIVYHHISWPVAMIIVFALAIVVGMANGVMVAYLRGNSFIITLAMGTVLTGVEYAFTKENTIYEGIPNAFLNIASGTSLGISNEIWIAAGITVVVWVLLDRTELGRYMYAIGGNQEAARLSGLRVRPYRLIGFVIVAVAATVVGMILISQSGSYAPDAGVPYLLPAFAAVFLGAAVFRPGEFNLLGTVVGVLFLEIISSGLIELNLQTFLINLVQGGILIVAVLVSRLGQRT